MLILTGRFLYGGFKQIIVAFLGRWLFSRRRYYRWRRWLIGRLRACLVVG